MALYPEIAAELRRLVAQAYQVDTVQGGLVHAAVEGFAVMAETGEWPEDVAEGVTWADFIADKIEAFSANKGIAPVPPNDYQLNYKGAAARIIGLLALDVPAGEILAAYTDPIIAARGGPGASHKNALLVYVADNIQTVSDAEAEA